MNSIDQRWLEDVRVRYAHCFGCGSDNHAGLKISGFETANDEVTANFVPKDEHRGFHDVLHGGVIATALDEILAWTAILVAKTMAVTAKLELRYRNPPPPGVEYLLKGRLVDQSGRRLKLEAECSAQGKPIAEASAIFLATDAIPAGAE